MRAERRARYICFEGIEGTGKSTQVNRISKHLSDLGFSVLTTKEQGTPHIPLTQDLRGIMLDVQYDKHLTTNARELISQAIRSIHLEKLIKPALKEYDFIIQDRGILSGLAYGNACGIPDDTISFLTRTIIPDGHYYDLYDDVILLDTNPTDGLYRANNAKREFNIGDVMESKGVRFIEEVQFKMHYYLKEFKNTHKIDVTSKSIQEVSSEILDQLKIRR